LLVSGEATSGQQSPGHAPPATHHAPLTTHQIKIRNLGLTILHTPARQTPSPGQAAQGGEVPGTPDFLAPEHALAGGPVDIRANLYNLGCIFYYVLSSQVPFPGGTATDKLHRHLKEEPKPVDEACPDVPCAVAAVVRRLLAKRPEDRFQTPADLFAALAPLPTTGTLSSASWTTVTSIVTALPPTDEKTPAQRDALPPPTTESTAPARIRSASRASRRPLLPGGRNQRWMIVATAGTLVLAIGFLLAVLLYPQKPVPATVPDEPPGPVSFALAYIKKPTREATILASLRGSHLPTFEGKWFYIGPFDNTKGEGFAKAYPPEQEIDLTKTYIGKGGAAVSWKEFPKFELNRIINLKLFQGGNNDHACIYLFHEYQAESSTPMTLSLGSDDTLSVWHNGKQLLAKNVHRGAAAGQDRVQLRPQLGKNRLLFKVCQGTGDWAFYIFPLWPDALERAFGERLRRDFP
jgi:hypothetical protein